MESAPEPRTRDPSLETAYSDEQAAALYNVLNPWGPSDDFYLDLIRQATSVLDVGCGTGQLLHRAREAHHTGRLCGVDPDPSMLAVASHRSDIEWVRATAASMTFDGEFELAVMTGHAFQALVGDDEISASLKAIRRALVDGGQFAFETRNPRAKAWESWDKAQMEVIDPSGRPLRVWYDVESILAGVVTLTEATADRDGTVLRRDRGRLRFIDAETLDRFLADTGFRVEARYGGWRREPLETSSEEIITIARAGSVAALGSPR